MRKSLASEKGSCDYSAYAGILKEENGFALDLLRVVEELARGSRVVLAGGEGGAFRVGGGVLYGGDEVTDLDAWMRSIWMCVTR